MRTPVDIGSLIDEGRWGRYQRRLVALTALTIIFDGIDNQLLGIALPAIMRDWSADRGDFAPVVSLGYFGMMLGSGLAGIVGDRFGRRVALVGSMLIFGGTTAAVAFVHDVSSLAVLRFVTGLGLGGAIPNAAALAAEYVPARQRPLAVTVTIVCVPAGGMLAGLFAIPALPALGWRALFVAGGLLTLVAALLVRRALPESPRYLARPPHRSAELSADLARMGREVPEGATFVDRTDAPVERVAVRTLFDTPFRTDTVGLWIAYFSCLLAVYLAFSWVPAMLVGEGFSPAAASAGITAFNLGGVAGALAGGVAIGRWGSRASMLVMTAFAAGSAALMSLTDVTPAATVVVVALLGVTGALINGVQTTMYALAAHVYPAAIRATGVGSAVSFGRVGAVLSGYVGAWALEYRGSLSFFAAIAVAMSVCWVGLAIVRRHVPGAGSGLKAIDTR